MAHDPWHFVTMYRSITHGEKVAEGAQATTKKLRYHLGSNKSHTVYEAEALAVVLALHTICEKNIPLTRLTIGLDNQALLLRIQNQKSKPGHYIIDKIHDALQDFQVTLSGL